MSKLMTEEEFNAQPELVELRARLERLRKDLAPGLAELQAAIHETATLKGWWDGDDHNDGEKIALMHSELSEALEAMRAGNPPSEKKLKTAAGAPISCVSEELADVVVRVFDFAGQNSHAVIDALFEKPLYNLWRKHKHGGKAF